MSASEEAIRLATLVLEGLTGLRTTEPKDLDVSILMHQDDIAEIGAGMLWGKTIVGAYWVEKGHPHLEVTVVL